MKTLLYVFAFIWFLIGLVTLVGGQPIGMSILNSGPPPGISGTVSDAATFGWFWLWTFPMPALLAGALGAVLGRLDDIRETIELANEREDSDEDYLEPEERMDPYIGEGSLDEQPESNRMKTKRDHTFS